MRRILGIAYISSLFHLS